MLIVWHKNNAYGVDIKLTPPLSMAFGWNHEEHKEEIFFSLVLFVSFVVPSLTSRSGE